MNGTDALEAGLEILRKRDQTELDVRNRLRSKGFDESQIDRAVDRLKSQGILNDRRFAESYVRRYAALRGAERLREELLRAGVGEELIDLALQSLPGDGAIALLRSKFSSERPSDRARAGRFLISRGFSEEEVTSALEAYFDATQEYSE